MNHNERMESLPSIEVQRKFLRETKLDDPRKKRILFVGRFHQGPTGIVSSLCRSLETLGHTVFRLDPAIQPDILDQSSGATGGYGPLFFKPRAIDQILTRFQPELIVFCAGGVVLTNEDSEYLRHLGILTLGLTLSDPDVQPSLIDYVANFDYHTTNSQLALGHYLTAGIRNTVLFPFGIDRQFVLRSVTEDKSLEADAICIGHATGRPDRHRFMRELAKYHSVKVYGTGWPFEGASTVSGDRLLQAGSAGTFHVNFPSTRAGFTNVKCGVFESVAMGGILCSARFDELASLFEYGTEILAYDAPEDLAASIATLKEDPHALEEIRRRGFHRLISDHLYEHRWLDLFHTIERMDDNPGPTSGLGGHPASAMERPKRVLISGFFGANNRGDEILLEAVGTRIERDVPAAQVVVGAVNAADVQRRHGWQAFRRTDTGESERWAALASSVILGPGGLWHDYTISKARGVSGIITGATVSPAHLVQLPLLAKAYGASFHVFGMGVGPLVDPAARAAVNLAGQLADTVSVRDIESADVLSGLGSWVDRVEVSPDLAYTFPIPPAAAPQEGAPTVTYKQVAVNVRPWNGDEIGRRVLSAALEFATKQSAKLVAVPMQSVDTELVERWLSDVPPEQAASVEVVATTASNEEFLSTISRSTAVVSMRLHTSLFAHRLGVPCVGITYDPKVASHFRELGRESASLPVDADTSRIVGALATAWNLPSLPNSTRLKVRELERAAELTLARLTETLSAAPTVESVGSFSWPEGTTEHSQTPKTDSQRDRAIPLSMGGIRSGNRLTHGRQVPWTRREESGGVTFGFRESGPQDGDFVSWVLEVPEIDAEGVRVELQIKSQYAEHRHLAGRLAYSVRANGKLLFRQDITAWQPRNTVWVAARNMDNPLELAVYLEALKDCEPWNWGREANITVEAVRVLPWVPVRDLAWGASSPASNLQADERDLRPTGRDPEPAAFSNRVRASRRGRVMRLLRQTLAKSRVMAVATPSRTDVTPSPPHAPSSDPR